MKWIKKILSRAFIVILAISAQLFIYAYVMDRLAEKYLYVSLPFHVLSVLFVLVVINRKMSSSYKIPWIVILLVMPIVGSALYLLLGYPRLKRKQRKKFSLIFEKTNKLCAQDKTVTAALKQEDSMAFGQAVYLSNTSGMPLYGSTETKYFSSGETAFIMLKERLIKAEKFIFMEYYIISESKMWDEILNILFIKVRNGVEIKLIYDDFGCSGRLKHNYHKMLKAKGIDCVKFNKLSPLITAVHNNRDHRKITVIDGREAFMGSFNIGDEYINSVSPFGYWKDSAVHLKGEAVCGLTIMFLRQFAGQSNKEIDFNKYSVGKSFVNAHGYVLPFGDGPAPLYNDYIGEQVYLNIINQAKRYVYITTPYLIVDYSFIEALKAAAKRGIDVRIITPGIADKKIINIMTKSNYEMLTKSGVKIYEFGVGFIHAKSFVSDDDIGVVGSINLDYRSFVHHFECGVWMYKTAAVDDMKADFLNTLKKCRYIDNSLSKLKWHQKLIASVLMLFAPLM